jgi:hypothetical protein
MRMRKLLLATGSIVVAGAIALAPAAQAVTPGAPIAQVSVGGSTVNGNHNINLTLKSLSLSLAVYGIPNNLICSGGIANGVVRSGTLGVPTYEMTLTTLVLACPSIFPGTTTTFGLTCGTDIDFVDLVHTGLLDTGATAANKFHRVAGTGYANCGAPDSIRVTVSNGCTYTMGGTFNAWFDEAIKVVSGVNYQDLYVTGTLRIHNPVNCAGAVTNGQGVNLNGVFNVQSPDGLIDFQ